MMRPPGLGLSPSCPRHGRAAQMMIQNRANSTLTSIGTGGNGELQEVQV